MIYYAFILTMPNVGSWNGKWTQSDKLFAKVEGFRKTPTLKTGNYYYSFGDGWGANVQVKEVTKEEAKQLKKFSKGFCGYDWMVTSLLDHGNILPDSIRQRREKEVQWKQAEGIIGAMLAVLGLQFLPWPGKVQGEK